MVVDDPLSPTNTAAKRPAVIAKDPLPASKKQPASKDLFEPIVITVPQTWVPKDGQKTDASGELKAVPETDAVPQCSLDVSDEGVTVLNGGGSVGILVTVAGGAGTRDIKTATSSAGDIEVRPEPEIEGLPGRRFFVIKSVSTRTGVFQVTFDSPCGKRDVVVRVR